MKRQFSHIPKSLQSVLWSGNVEKMDLKRDKGYIIHQVLIYGDINDFRWLFEAYSKKDVIQTFLTVPYKSYSPERFHFVSNFLLGLKNYQFNERLYVQNTPRDLGYEKSQPAFKVVGV